MSENHQDNLIQYRLDRAQETYDEAVLMKREKHWNTCANRLYYSCFYAVLALLEKHGFASSKHSGVKSFFNQRFIKTGKISKEQGKLYNNLFDARQEGDYIDFVYFDADIVEPWFPKVKDFIAIITNLINE
ncbi:MAG: HEPN domain-containing protein [Candidatus Desulfaltia sp.]|nr:HEPN domain-containing protein [Candidatus Desulfaltia sp.]